MRTKSSIPAAVVAILCLCSQSVTAQTNTFRYPTSGPTHVPYQAVAPQTGTSRFNVEVVPKGMSPEALPLADLVADEPGFAFEMSQYSNSAATGVASVGYDASMDCPGGVCDAKSGDCKGKDEACCPTYHLRVFADFLYLRPRDAEVAYGVISNLDIPSNVLPPVQVSPIGLTDPDYSSGFRGGFAFCMDECSELEISYTLFQSSTNSILQRDLANSTTELFPMTIHPATENTVIGTAEAAANLDIDFDLIDITYRRIVQRTCQTDVFAEVGLRYGNLNQSFFARYTDDLASPNNDSDVYSDVDFNGVGLTLGLDVDHYSNCHPVMVYMKGMTSLLAGEFDTSYQQYIQGNSYPGVNTSWQAGRIVPTFDLEIGGGFYMPRGTLRATVGYAYSAWANVVKTEDWIHAVQTNDFRDMSDTITFDGFVFRVEGRF